MAHGNMPEELRRYLLTAVPSVPYVEALLVFRECREEPVTVQALARRLYIPEGQAAEIVAQLLAAQIVRAEGASHRYSPHPEHAPLLDLLATWYRKSLVEVTEAIHSRTGRMAQHFADAFRIRKD